MSELVIYKHGIADGMFLTFLFQIIGMLILSAVFVF